MAPSAYKWQPAAAQVQGNIDFALPFDPESYATGSNGSALSVNFAADANAIHILKQIICSYEVTPTLGTVTVTETDSTPTTTTLFKMALTTSGTIVIDFSPPRQNTGKNKSLKIEMADGGAVKYLFCNVYKLF